MCKESKTCLCHRMKDFIIADKKIRDDKKFARFFNEIRISELYLFLRDAYTLMGNTSDSAKFDEKLSTLAVTYLPVINANDEKVKTKFRHGYKKYLKQEFDKQTLLERLERLVHDVEKLAYNNLSDNPAVVDLLQTEPPKSLHSRSLSARLLKFIQKSPSSSDVPDSSRGESPSSSSASSSSSPSSSN